MTRSSNDPFGPSATTPPDRLESWKEIAAYLNRSVTTVQRWEQEEGLPVRRLLHGKAGSVYALKRELDDWYSRRDPRLDADLPAEAAAPVIHLVPHAPTPVAPPHAPPAVPRASTPVAAAIAAPVPLAPATPAGETTVPIPEPAKSGHRPLALVILPLVALAAALGAGWFWRAWHPTATERAPIVRAHLTVAPAEDVFSASLPRFTWTRGGSATALAWTRDGRRLIFVGVRNDTPQLFVRDLEQSEARALPGTEGARWPALSPDGRSVVYWTGDVKRVPIEGGLAETIAKGTPWPRGLAVGAMGRVVYGGGDAIWQVTAGSTPVRVTTLAKGEVDHVLPALLANDSVLLFTARNDQESWGHPRVVAQVLATGQRTTLVENAADARYVPPGYLVFLRLGVLMAVPFDLGRLAVTGAPVSLVDGVAQALAAGSTGDITLAGQFSISATGALAYIRSPVVPPPDAALVAIDRRGRVRSLPFETRRYDPLLDVSPDGRRLAVPTLSPEEPQTLWIADLTRGSLTRLGPGRAPRWTPDGQRLAFSWVHDGRDEVVWQRVDGSASPEVLTTESCFPSSWSPDGQHLACAGLNGGVFVVSVGRRPPTVTRLVDLEGATHPLFSPDGRWLAYVSARNGRNEVYVRPYPGPGPSTQVSTAGGGSPAWNPGGGELFYVGYGKDGGYGPDGDLLSVAIEGDRIGLPTRLSGNLVGDCHPVRCYGVAADGQQFYIRMKLPRDPIPRVTDIEVVLNWVDELKAKVAEAQGKD